jgi:protein-L-isoaspartate(D-aspartate) O-methyltransferase
VNSVKECRESYADFVVKSTGMADAKLIAAFASVEREKYLGEGPWVILDADAYQPIVSDDPRQLYQDVLVRIAGERGINNGQPTLHAACLQACRPVEGETVVHIGAGTGYYSAILAALVGAAGKVLAYEIEPDLARRARENLRQLTNVTVLSRSATEGLLPKADVIYVNAGATHPVASWLDALNVGGRLIFPLTPNEGFGCMLLVTRRSAASHAATVVASAVFIPCSGARDEVASEALAVAFATRSPRCIRSLHRGTAPDNTVWCAGTDWWLSTAEPQ